jgi:hypothetical protein
VAARPKYWHILQASKREALIAVDLYNRVASERSLEGFVVHMHLAWLYLHHARFQRDAVDFRYRESDGRRFVRVDGEVKTWELSRCLKETFPDGKSPVRANVEFFIKIRNKVEHRYEKLLATALAGLVWCQGRARRRPAVPSVRVELDAGRGEGVEGDVPPAAEEAQQFHP